MPREHPAKLPHPERSDSVILASSVLSKDCLEELVAWALHWRVSCPLMGSGLDWSGLSANGA